MKTLRICLFLGCFSALCSVAYGGIYLGTDYAPPPKEPNPVPLYAVKKTQDLQPATGHYRPPQTTEETFTLSAPPLKNGSSISIAKKDSSPMVVASQDKKQKEIPASSATEPKKTIVPMACSTAHGKGPCEPPLPVASYPIYDGLIVRLHSGSLRENVIHIVEKSGWGHVVWTLPFDYKWIGDIALKGPDVQSVLAQLLKPYPVQAVFYDKNRVVAVVDRRPL
jgi:hypothetical protein